MEMFLSLLLLLSAWTAQETFCRSLNNSTGNGGISTGPASEEGSEMMHHPGFSSPAGGNKVGKQESDVKLTWEKPSEIEVVFANGTKDTIHLKTVTDPEGKAILCLYTGSLDHDSEESEVTVDGCKGDKKVLVEIASKNEVGGLLVLVIENGKTYELQQEDKHWMGNDALEIPSEFFNSTLPSSKQASLPRSVTVETSFRYDKSLLAQFNNDHETVRDHLYRVAEYSKPILKLLDVQVNLKVTSVEPYDQYIKASGKSLKALTKELGGKNLKGPISFFTGQNNEGPVGIAWLGTACHTTTGYQININEVYNGNIQATAEIFVHELGHNLGMRHDFAEENGGPGNPCDGKGMMSYVRPPRPAWSTCSNKDFANWYQAEGNQCLN